MKFYLSLKVFIATCFTAILFIGTPNSSAYAFSAEQAINGEIIQTIKEPFGFTESGNTAADNNGSHWRDIKNMLQIEENLEEFTSQVVNSAAAPAISLTNEERDLLERIVEAEAKGESFEGKVAVAIVVLNRLESPAFPNSIKEVIYQVVGKSYAFTPVQNGEINKPASEESKKAVIEALTRNERLHDAVYFYNPKIATDNWIRSRQIVATIGNHVFAL